MGDVLKLVERSEADILAMCIGLLNFHRARGTLTFRRISTQGIRRNIRGRDVFTKNSAAGFPDVIVFLRQVLIGNCLCGAMEWRRPKILLWEIKSPKGKLSDVQLEFKEELARVGHEIEVIRSADDAVMSLKREGIYG